VCLLIVLSRVVPDWPLVLAANRDERFDRPAVPVGLLRTDAPRTLGGRDLLAGGTWLAVNEDGVAAGLTNAPIPGGRDGSKRTRGEIPLQLSAFTTAAEAAAAFEAWSIAGAFNPCWVLVGDRTGLTSFDLTDPDTLGASSWHPACTYSRTSRLARRAPRSNTCGDFSATCEARQSTS